MRYCLNDNAHGMGYSGTWLVCEYIRTCTYVCMYLVEYIMYACM